MIGADDVEKAKYDKVLAHWDILNRRCSSLLHLFDLCPEG
jgi:hypothetical protein